MCCVSERFWRETTKHLDGMAVNNIVATTRYSAKSSPREYNVYEPIFFDVYHKKYRTPRGIPLAVCFPASILPNGSDTVYYIRGTQTLDIVI